MAWCELTTLIPRRWRKQGPSLFNMFCENMAVQHLNQWCGNVVMVTLHGLVFMLSDQGSFVEDTDANKQTRTIRNHSHNINTNLLHIHFGS